MKSAEVCVKGNENHSEGTTRHNYALTVHTGILLTLFPPCNTSDPLAAPGLESRIFKVQEFCETLIIGGGSETVLC